MCPAHTSRTGGICYSCVGFPQALPAGAAFGWGWWGLGGLGGKWAVVVAGRVVGSGSFFFLRTGTGRARENVLVLTKTYFS